MKTAHEQWLDFANAIGIGTMDPKSVQYVETRRAFYAGMLAMMTTMRERADAYPDTEEGERRAAEELEGLHQEIVAFCERVKKGLA